MIKRILLVAAWGLILGFTASPGWTAIGDPAKGRATYEKICINCHGARGKGDGPTGRLTKPPAADLTSSQVKDKTDDAELLQTIQNGRPGTAMAGMKGELSDQQIHDVLAYIRSLGR